MIRSALIAASALTLCLACGDVTAENWPQWRGPQGDNSSREQNLPIVWDENRSVLWKCPLPEFGNSTPAVWEDAIFLTSHTEDRDLVLLRIDARSGKVVWQQKVGEGSARRQAPKRGGMKFHRSHNLATPSPVTDGETVVVLFGNGDIAAYDFDGTQKWKRNLQSDHGQFTIWWGYGSSPVLFEDTVIAVCMQDSLADQLEEAGCEKPSESYLVAYDLATGRTRWKTLRTTDATAEECDAYTTPLLRKTDRSWELLVMGGNQLDAYHPATGKQRWKLPGLVGGRTITGPTVSNDLRLVFVTQGMRGPTVAVRLDGPSQRPAGDESPRELSYRDIAWRWRTGTPDCVSPVCYHHLLFTVTDDGIMRCLDAEHGRLKWKQRLPGAYRATPLLCEGRLFVLNTDGLCSVISATARFDKLLENKVQDTTIASPVAAHGRLYIRGHKKLYCIGRQPSQRGIAVPR